MLEFAISLRLHSKMSYYNFVSWFKLFVAFIFLLKCINDSSRIYSNKFALGYVHGTGKLNSGWSVICVIIIFQAFDNCVLLFWLENAFSLSNYLTFCAFMPEFCVFFLNGYHLREPITGVLIATGATATQQPTKRVHT